MKPRRRKTNNSDRDYWPFFFIEVCVVFVLKKDFRSRFVVFEEMTRPKGQKRFAEMKRMIKLTDARLKAKDRVKPKNHEKKEEKKKEGEIQEKQVAPVASALFFRYNTQLGKTNFSLVPPSPIDLRRFRSALSRHRRHELYQLFDQSQTRYHSIDDGLSLCQMHALHHRLCDGRNREIRHEVSCCSTYREGSSIRTLTLLAQGHLR